MTLLMKARSLVPVTCGIIKPNSAIFIIKLNSATLTIQLNSSNFRFQSLHTNAGESNDSFVEKVPINRNICQIVCVDILLR